MSFVGKFKPGTSNTNEAPQGVNMEHTSFGYSQNQKPYIKPQLQKDATATQKAKPRGGWEEEEDDAPQIKGNSGPYKGNQTTQQAKLIMSPGSASSTSNKSDDLAFVSTGKKTSSTVDYEIMSIDEKFVQTHEYENNMINEMIQPGGARLKQPDSSLNNFCTACESFQAPVVGTLLISKLYEEIPYVSKARLLFLIEAVVKKVKKFNQYFKHNINVLKELDFSNEGQNAAQLAKITGDLIKYIEEPNKPKQPVIPPTTTSATLSSANANILDDDLLGPSQPKGKQDPFAFLKKAASDKTSQSQATANHDFDLLDFSSESQSFPSQQQHQQPVVSQSQPYFQSQPQTQSFSQPQAQQIFFQAQSQAQAERPLSQAQPQVQPKKFNPFGLSESSPSTSQSSQSTAKTSIGLPGNFKKFQNTTAPNQSAPIESTQNSVGFQNITTHSNNQHLLDQNKTSKPTATLDQLDDLLESFSGIDFGANKAETPAPSNQTGLQGAGSTNQSITQSQQGSSTQNTGYANPQVHRLANNYNPLANQPQGQTNKPTPTPTSTQTQPNPYYSGPGVSGGPGGPGAFPGGPHVYPAGPGVFQGAHVAFPGGPGGFPSYGPNPHMNTNYPPQGYPGYNYPPNPNYGHGQPQYGTGHYGQPQNIGGNMNQGQPGMYGGSAPYQGQSNMLGYNPYQGQPGKK